MSSVRPVTLRWRPLTDDVVGEGGAALGVGSMDLEMELGLLASTFQDDATYSVYIGTLDGVLDAIEPLKLPLDGHHTPGANTLTVSTRKARQHALENNALWNRSIPEITLDAAERCLLLQVDISREVRPGSSARASMRFVINSSGYACGPEDGSEPFVQALVSVPFAEKVYESEVQASLDSLCCDGSMVLFQSVGVVSEALETVPLTVANGRWGVCMRCSQRNAKKGLPKVPCLLVEDAVNTSKGPKKDDELDPIRSLSKCWKCTECDSPDVVYLPSLKSVPPEEMEDTPCSFCLCEERALIDFPCGDRCCVPCFVRMCDVAVGSKEVYKVCADMIVRSAWGTMREKAKEEECGLVPPPNYPFTPSQVVTILRRGVTVVCPNHKGCARGLITDLSLLKLLPIPVLSRYNAFALQHSLLHEDTPPVIDDLGETTNTGLTGTYGTLYATRCPLPSCIGSVYVSGQSHGCMMCPYCNGLYCHRCGTPPEECACGAIYSFAGIGFPKCPSEALVRLGLPLGDPKAWANHQERGAAASNAGVFDALYYTLPLDLPTTVFRLPLRIRKPVIQAFDSKRSMATLEKEFKKATASLTLGRRFDNDPSAAQTKIETEDTYQQTLKNELLQVTPEARVVLQWTTNLIRRRAKDFIKAVRARPKWKAVCLVDPTLASVELISRTAAGDKYNVRVGSASAKEGALQHCWDYSKDYTQLKRDLPQRLTRELFENRFNNLSAEHAILYLVRMCFRTIPVVVVYRGVSFSIRVPVDMPAHCSVSTHLLLQAASNACPVVHPRAPAPLSADTFVANSDCAEPPAEMCQYAHLVWQLIRVVESTKNRWGVSSVVTVDVGWADVLRLALEDTAAGVITGCVAPRSSWNSSFDRAMFVTSGAALSVTTVDSDARLLGCFSTALSAPTHSNLVQPGSTIFALDYFIKDGTYGTTLSTLMESFLGSQVSNSKPSTGLHTIARQCPNCLSPTVHYLGHGCHIIRCTRRCGIEWCFACGAICTSHMCPRGCTLFCEYDIVYKRKELPPGSTSAEVPRPPAGQLGADMEERSLRIRVERGELIFSHIQGKQCSCTICPDCRPQMPCSICSGCPVCTGIGVGVMRHLVLGEDNDGNIVEEADSSSDGESSEGGSEADLGSSSSSWQDEAEQDLLEDEEVATTE